MTTTCPTCEETVTTKVVYTSGITSWIICMGMIFWGYVQFHRFVTICKHGLYKEAHVLSACMPKGY